MFILRDILLPLQDHFSETNLGRERASLLVCTILSISFHSRRRWLLMYGVAFDRVFY